MHCPETNSPAETTPGNLPGWPLSYLKQLPLDELKIDRSFILGIRSESDDAPIVTSIISMAHSLNLRVVMEGIETGAPVVFYRERSCEYLGFLFSKPVPGVEFASRLKVQARD